VNNEVCNLQTCILLYFQILPPNSMTESHHSSKIQSWSFYISCLVVLTLVISKGCRKYLHVGNFIRYWTHTCESSIQEHWEAHGTWPCVTITERNTRTPQHSFHLELYYAPYFHLKLAPKHALYWILQSPKPSIWPHVGSHSCLEPVPGPKLFLVPHPPETSVWRWIILGPTLI
jgi:hypothetical protein